ncbi:MAG TPA: alkaline phosphatase PhoX [Luteibaculaceae bacterium]|nr:alkaline phosphatase PhoX [Luteibaculaceae bacterium]
MKKVLLAGAIAMAFTGLRAQQIGEFLSIEPQAQTQRVVMPSSHAFQVLIQTGIILPDLSVAQVFPDFTGFVPKNGSSTSGYLCINHEVVPGGVTVLEIELNPATQTWDILSSKNVNFLLLGGSGFNCSGGTTPWGTSITSEETYDQFPDLNQDGYVDLGWNTEIDPVSGTVVDQDGDGQPDKLWKLGRLKHENVVVHPDRIRVYQGADDGGFGYLYKFVADQPEKLGAGKLFVLVMDSANGDNFSATGRWVQLQNDTPEQCNTVQTQAANVNATNFRRIEDVEVGPDGKIYFAATSPGNIYRLEDTGEGVAAFETYAARGEYLINHANGSTPYLFEKCDNLVFDCDGNLWVTEDGEKFHVWVIGASHSTSNPNIRLFMGTPTSTPEPTGNISGAEPTGITFTPDCKYGFMSMQRCGLLNTAVQQDAAGQNIIFNRDATLVFSRSEFLGNSTGVFETSKLAPARLAPNPASTYTEVHFESTAGQELTLSIHDQLGRQVADIPFTSVQGKNTIKIDTFLFPAGVYGVTIRSGESLIHQAKLSINP